MAERRNNPVIKNEFVIIAPERLNRPYAFQRSPPISLSDGCPFCPGNESKTLPETLSYRYPGSQSNDPGWWVRFVSNKYPAVSKETELISLEKETNSLFQKSLITGIHEVGITRYHGNDFGQPGFDDQYNLTRELLWAIHERKLSLARENPKINYAEFFKNRGVDAGGSLDHPHIQLLALESIPSKIQAEFDTALEYLLNNEACIYCDIIEAELKSEKRIINQNEHYIVLEPFASKFPYETWIIPKSHERNYSLTPEKATSLANIVKDTFMRLNVLLNNPDYNFYIKDCSLNNNGRIPIKEIRELSYHWYIDLSPRLTKASSWEYSTDVWINPICPEKAADDLRKVRVS